MAAYFFECSICGYDSDEVGYLVAQLPEHLPICPLCAGDTGHDEVLSFRPATLYERSKLRVKGAS